MDEPDAGWTVLAILGPSGVGMSVAAQAIAQARGMTWIQVDDLRLAMQASDIERPSGTLDRLHYFECTTDIWSCSSEELKDALVDLACLMAPAVRIVIDSHIATGVPAVIEGDGILPALSTDSVLRPHIATGRLRFCCVAPESVDELLFNARARGRGIGDLRDDQQIRQAKMNLSFGQWLVEDSGRSEVPVVRSRPLATLPDRILAATGGV